MKENSLKKYVDDFFEDLVLYDDYMNGHYYKDLLKAGIDVFLVNENSYNAFEIYQTFFMIYQITREDKSHANEKPSKDIVSEPNTLLDLVKIMKKYEENTGDLIDKQRDHFIHSVNVFLLGLAIYSQNKNYRDKFREYIIKSPYKKYYKIDGEFSHEEFLYRWGIAALFHDIGYPVEIIGKQLRKFINDSVNSISTAYDADIAIDFKDFDEFNSIVKLDPAFTDNFREAYPKSKFLDLFKPTDIMAYKIATDFPEIDVNQLIKHLNNFIDIMGDSGFIDHGFFSSILVLDAYGYLIQKHAKDNDFFFYPIVDSGSAILLHNYYRNVLQKKFGLGGMHPGDSPLAYLLILCDELQEWNRQPYGIQDRKRNRVNELLLEINDNKLNVEYKSGPMGLGFSEDKEELLKNLLKIRSIFKSDLTVTTEVQQDAVMKKIVQSEIRAPDVLLRNIEKLAIRIHNQYNNTLESQYQEKLKNNIPIDKEFQDKYDNRCSFEELTPHLKIANIRQARSIPRKLSIIGCDIVDKNEEGEAITEFSPEEVLDLAKLEHKEWCEEKIRTGWTYGEKKDVKNLITPYLIPWDELDDDIKQLDIDPIKHMPELMDSIDMKIVRTKTRLLTFKMHDFYNEENNISGDFADLPDYIKYSNYKQTDFLVKMLEELGYNVVSKESGGTAIDSFNDDVVDYLAKREHAGWCKVRFDLGWKHGDKRDDKLKINPNLVSWGELDDSIKLANKHTFENLPRLCDEVGLKIVK
ncbi:RyR domain-containing protein [Methanobrevibacter sp.]|uniref:RyR domain-containing protein n=1 Tax=Methanobrevibacter sp. TaxID=66852 RepID=UPI00386540DA